MPFHHLPSSGCERDQRCSTDTGCLRFTVANTSPEPNWQHLSNALSVARTQARRRVNG